MKALVTGGTGFLGGHIVRALLRRGDEVAIYDHRLRGKLLSDEVLKSVRAIESDIRDAGAVRDAVAGCDVVFHCAAMMGVSAYSSRPAMTMEIEEVGLRNVCNAIVAGGHAKVMYASSSAAYGNRAGCWRETDVAAPVSNYGIAKRYNEVYLTSLRSEYDLRSVSFRIFNIYGPLQDQRLVIPRFILNAIRNEDLVIYGKGDQTRDFVLVSDAVDAMLACADRASGCEIVNLCTGRELSVYQLAEKIIELTGSKSKIVLHPYPPERVTFEVEHCYGSTERLEATIGPLGWASIDEGLSRTIASMRDKA